MEKEVVVIGAGPAGLSAAVYLGRARMDAVVLGYPEKSQAMKAHVVMNYLGYPSGISGKEFMKRALMQAKRCNVRVMKNEAVNIEKKKAFFNIKIDDGSILKARSIIIATGTPIKLSGIKNEEMYTSKGVHYCVECDGDFYAGKKIAVIGHGNHAAEEALSLLAYTKHVTMISNSDKFEISRNMRRELKRRKIKLLNKAVESFEGKNKLEYIRLFGGKNMEFDAAFMGCGELSALDFSSKLALRISGDEILVDKNCMTNENGVFAAGNCVSKCRQIAKAVGDGCNAALSAIKFIRNKEVYQDYSASNRK